MNKQYNIIIADDNPEICKLLELYLEAEDFNVFIAHNGIEALKIMKSNDIDVAIFDIMMPHMNGYELTKEVRKFSNVHILFLSAKDQDNDKIVGLNIGGDDYITKPFNPLEVVARVKSVARRIDKYKESNETNSLITIADLSLDLITCELKNNDELINLTATEYKILSLLMKNAGRIYTKGQISEYINGDYYETDDNSITVHISHLRDKLRIANSDKQYIVTMKGLGYKFEK